MGVNSEISGCTVDVDSESWWMWIVDVYSGGQWMWTVKVGIVEVDISGCRQ